MDNKELTERLAVVDDLLRRIRHLESIFDALAKFDADLADIARRIELLEAEPGKSGG